MLVSCSSELNVASCAMNSVFDCGLVGSWFCSWITSSFRNASLPRPSLSCVPSGSTGTSGVVLVFDPTPLTATVDAPFHPTTPHVLQRGQLIERLHFPLALFFHEPGDGALTKPFH